MPCPRLIQITCSFAILLSSVVAQETVTPIAGIGPTGPIQSIHDGFAFKFTEGPAADAEGGLYFTDVFAGRIYRVESEDEPTLILEKSAGMNGLMFDSKGRLIGCKGGAGSIVSIDVKTGEMTTVAGEYDGKRFNRPNDLVIDRSGGVYFTDPKFGRGTQDVEGVYYISADADVSQLTGTLKFPNGITMSPDESTLYVLQYQAQELMAYPVESPGKVGEGRVFCKVDSGDKTPAGGDGMTVDTDGNLYLTAPAKQAIQVVSPEGKTLGMIPLPAKPTNCAFGGPDMKTLYVTAMKQMFALPMETTGHRFAAGL